MKTLTFKTLTLIVPLTLLAGCGLSASEVDDRGTDDRSGEEAGLSSAGAAGARCARGQAYCPSTGRCYPEACLSCCFVPSCGKGQAYCPSTNSCYPEACLSCCRLGQPATDPSPNTDPPVCDPALCGPAPAMPTIQCADGSVGGFTGRCLPRDGRCGWEIRRCPTADADVR
jgi:hypothetical protein